jgi:TRAP-type C4-dicarboxylate transport system substrate-binding protein
MKKNAYSLILSLLVGIFVIMPISPEVSAKSDVITLRFGEHAPTVMGRSVLTYWFAKELERRTEGKVKVNVFWGESLAKGRELLKAVQTGIADMAYMASAYYVDQFPAAQLFGLPFTHPNLMVNILTVREMYDKFPSLRAELEKYNLRPVYYTDGYMYKLRTTKPVKSLAETKGLKIRATGAAQPKILKELGAFPVTVAGGETYEALLRGVLDGALWPLHAYIQYKIIEPAPYTLNMGVTRFPVLHYPINLDTWKKLPIGIQKIIEEVGNEITMMYGIYMLGIEEDITKEAIQKYGAKFFDITGAELKKLKEIAEPMWSDWAKKADAMGIPGKNLVQAYDTISAKYEEKIEDIKKTNKSILDRYMKLYGDKQK